MNFKHYRSTLDTIRRDTPVKTSLRMLCDAMKKLLDNPISSVMVEVEREWAEAGRPYYNVWPSIISPLLKLKLDQVSSSCLAQMEPKVLSFGFADRPYTVLAYNADLNETNYNGIRHGLVMFVDTGKTEDGVPINRPLVLPHIPGASIQESLDRFRVDRIYPEMSFEISQDIAKIVASCILISRDAEDGLVEADVLNSDRQKYHQTGDPKLVAKAIRRGKFGWDIGRQLEVNPHWRSAHLCTFHTGRGRTETVIKLRKGGLIKREKVKQMPAGHMEEL